MTDLVLRQAGQMWRAARGVDTVWLLVLLIPAIVGVLDPDGLVEFVVFAVSALAHTAPYILIAVSLMGFLKATGAEGMVAAAFKGRETRMIVFAALVGGLAPFCSCEVIPFVAALLAAGVPVSAVMAFWLSSPLMDPPQFMITTAALGLDYAIAKMVFAVVIGLGGGFLMRELMARGAFADPLRPRAPSAGGCCGAGPAPVVETSCCGAPSVKPHWRFWEQTERRAIFGATVLENGVFLLKWMSLAYLLEASMVLYVPAEIIASVVGGSGVWPVVLGALVGAPAYLNGYAAPALVSGLIEQGMSPGAAMSFMIAGAVSCIPAMAAVFALVRRAVFAMYVMLGLGGAILCGLLFGAVTGGI